MNPLLLDIPSRIETARLTLRVPAPGDGPGVNAAIVSSQKELAEFMPWAVLLPTVDESEIWVRKAYADFHSRAQIQYHAYLKGTETLAVSVGFPRLDWTIPRLEIGYWVVTAYAGQGYVTEASRVLIALAFNHLGAARIDLHCDARNSRSMRVARRLGFTLEGTLHHDARDPQGVLRDTHVFARFPQ